MATQALMAPHSTSNSPMGSPTTSSHKKAGSTTSQGHTSRSAKRKSWQTSEVPHFGIPWTGTANSNLWESIPAPWSSEAVAADVTALTPQNDSNGGSNFIVQDDHLHPNVYEDPLHKYSPASSTRNSVQSVPNTTPSLMGSQDSPMEHGGLISAHGPAHYNPGPHHPSGAFHGQVQGYPQLTIQTSQLSQPQSPPGTYGAHYQPHQRHAYPPSRDYRYSYGQGYTSPTQAVAPSNIYSPVLQHPHNVTHDYFRHPTAPLYFPEYLTSPTSAAPSGPAGLLFGGMHQPVGWTGPAAAPSTGRNQPHAGAMHLRWQSDQLQNRHYPSVMTAMRPISGAQMPPIAHFIAQPNKQAVPLPPKSVTLPVRGRHSSTPARLPATTSANHPINHVIGRNNRRDQRESTSVARSAVLEDFRNNRNKRWDLKDIEGHIVEFSCDQHGSRFIQHKLLTAQEAPRSMVYRSIIPNNVLLLARDVFGNYVLQKLCELGTPAERSAVANILEGNLLALSLNMYGCRVLQKMIDFLSAEEQARWVAELNGHILQCVKDANGNHVIQKFLESPLSDRSFFVATFKNHVYELATHAYGCRVLQRCFEHVEPDLVRPLLNELHLRTLNLMQDQYGNYVIQFILEKGSVHDRDRVIQNLTGYMLPMSKHKFASNVCEKALQAANTEQRRGLIEEISLMRPDGMNPIITMIKDQYANYVLQRALQIAEEPKPLDGVLIALRPQLLAMRRHSSTSPFTKHISSIERILRERDIDINAKEYSSPISANSDSTTTPTLETAPPGV